MTGYDNGSVVNGDTIIAVFRREKCLGSVDVVHDYFEVMHTFLFKVGCRYFFDKNAVTDDAVFCNDL